MTVPSHRLPPAIFLMGPTASGKTDLAVALLHDLPVEIISVDSANVYREMDIGTAKPDAEILRIAPHHLIDMIDPTESYSAARFRADALPLMQDIVSRGRIPLLVGGTMLYYRALQEGLDELPPADPEVRSRIEMEAQQLGWPALHARLAQLDPLTAARLNPNDAQRINRALEVCLLTGRPMSASLTGGRREPLPFAVQAIGLVPSDRGVLHERIACRFDRMLANGLVEEVEQLRQKYPLTLELPSMRAVGYRQAWLHLDGLYDWQQLRERGVIATRQLAKRQMTWLRGMPEVQLFDCLAPDLYARVREHLLRHLQP